MPRDLRIALLGFGNVGRRFAERLGGPYLRALQREGVRPLVTGVATARHGSALDQRGLDVRACLRAVRGSGSLASLHFGLPVRSAADFIARVEADALVLVTPTDPKRGEPATTHVRLALTRGLNVVTANKGPVAFARRRLKALAARRQRLFLHEGAVMDGAPVFNLVEQCLPGLRVLGFRGNLNSTTNHILSRLEAGRSFDTALAEAQAQGIAEADPAHDLDGWDAALKGCALANGLLGASVHPRAVKRQGIRGLSGPVVLTALREGRRIRLVVRGERKGRHVRVSVRPERLPVGDPLAGSGPDAALVLRTDLMGEIGILERGMSVDQTAYALLADLVVVARSLTRSY
jgi:homoserine dehydrogenase